MEEITEEQIWGIARSYIQAGEQGKFIALVLNLTCEGRPELAQQINNYRNRVELGYEI